MKYFLFIVFSSICFVSVWSQIIDSFDDGDFTNNPTWVGSTANFIVNASNELQLNAPDAGESYLSTPHNLTQLKDREWRYKVKYSFSPSNNNYGLTYLTATDSDLSTSPDGIFFRIGENGSDDPIELIERLGGVETTILKSTPTIVANSFNIRIKIIHRTNGDWELYTDLTGGEAFQLDTLVNYPTAILGDHIGVWLKYTTSNKDKFIYDDFYAGMIQIDVTPPVLDTIYAVSSTELRVLFNEGIDKVSGEIASNYSIDKGIGSPTNVLQDVSNLALFRLIFSTPFDIGELYTLTAKNVQDYEGNPMVTESKTFQFVEAEIPVFGDIIINEFIQKVTPSVGLPESQFVELYNRSNKYFHLNDWKLSDNNSSGTIGDVWLFPEEYLILVPSSGLADYPQATVVSSWAQLNQTGDDIGLTTDDGILVDKLTYTTEWYKDKNKEGGGWSIERINPELVCSSADNWRASVHSSGGTPGAQNSVYDNTPDTIVPIVKKVKAEFPNKLILTFSKGMDAGSLLNTPFSSSPELSVISRIINGAYPIEVIFEFEDTLISGKVYTFSFNDFSDCSGNIGSYEGFFVIPQTPEKGDLIINEILFNPYTGGSDFVEIYNNSDKYIDLKDWQLANYKDGEVANQKPVEVNYLLSPDDYVVLTKDANFQIMKYPYAIPDKFIQMTALPSYNNDSSTVLIIYNDTVMDKVSYQESWQFSLLSSTKGVSLERFSPNQPSNTPSNWHSASETVGFATPGRVNSQNMNLNNDGGKLTLSSKTFSPDGDGFEDVLVLTYEVTSPDLLGDITIYDDKGRKVKSLFKSHLLGSTGSVKWEGTKDNGTKAAIGPYIIIFEIFNLDSSKVESIRKVVTLAGRL